VFPLNWVDPATGEQSSGYREKGYFPEAFVNMLALLGWHASGNKELFSLEELVQEFSLERVSKSGAKFDPEKTKWFNQQYLRMRTDEELAAAFMAEVKEKMPDGKADLDYVIKVCGLIKEKANFLTEFWSLGSYFFREPETYDPDVMKKRWNERSKGFMADLAKVYADVQDFSAANAESVFKQTCEKAGIKSGEVMQLFRVCISGVAGGPALFDAAALIGKDRIVSRLQAVVAKF
jgi:glutamyl-tRNA synthetase